MSNRSVAPDDFLRSISKRVGGIVGNSGSLRASVLGVNDGLISNFGLVMGVAGGTGRTDFVLLAGIAGLLAGAFSMAAGEYISMRSQSDLHERQLEIAEAELLESPEDDEADIIAIYEAKGLSLEDAQEIAQRIMARPQAALETKVREGLGLDPDDLGSPWAAALSSFAAFIAGAIVPILPYMVDTGGRSSFVLSGLLSAIFLSIIGGALGLLAGKNIAWSAFRMLLVGVFTAAITYSVGKLVGVSVFG